MQDIDYLTDSIRNETKEKLIEEKRNQINDVIAESKISLIKLGAFVRDSPLLPKRFLNPLFFSFKGLQWAGILLTFIHLPTLFYEFGIFKEFTESIQNISFLGGSLYLQFLIISVCSIIIGFLGARFIKLQIKIELNRKIAQELHEHIKQNLSHVKVY